MTSRGHHVPCRGGCGELSDECACRKPNPLGSMTIAPAIGSHSYPTEVWEVCTGCCPSCDGMGCGGPASGPETSGLCADCRGTGHDWDHSGDQRWEASE